VGSTQRARRPQRRVLCILGRHFHRAMGALARRGGQPMRGRRRRRELGMLLLDRTGGTVVSLDRHFGIVFNPGSYSFDMSGI
jgi:hypothetical protein